MLQCVLVGRDIASCLSIYIWTQVSWSRTRRVFFIFILRHFFNIAFSIMTLRSSVILDLKSSGDCWWQLVLVLSCRNKSHKPSGGSRPVLPYLLSPSLKFSGPNHQLHSEQLKYSQVIWAELRVEMPLFYICASRLWRCKKPGDWPRGSV